MTSYSYDPIIGKYFAQVRFYNAEQGRMMGKGPVKRGLNAYPYCDNDPVYYVDPTGEISNIVAESAANGAVVGAVRSPLSNRVEEPMMYGYRYDVGSLKKTGEGVLIP